jgi:hypothetical protein
MAQSLAKRSALLPLWPAALSYLPVHRDRLGESPSSAAVRRACNATRNLGELRALVHGVALLLAPDHKNVPLHARLRSPIAISTNLELF